MIIALMDWNVFALTSQIVLTSYFVVTHWIPLAPFNNLSKEAFAQEKKINATLQIIQCVLAYGVAAKNFWLSGVGVIFYSFWMLGHLMSWWIPYFFGVPKAFLEEAAKDNQLTLSFYRFGVRKAVFIPYPISCIAF